MSAFEVVAILLAGVAAGTINTIVGSGSLVTFPTLLFFGYPPLVANMSNIIGLVPGGLSGVHGYRLVVVGIGVSFFLQALNGWMIIRTDLESAMAAAS